jgi:nucleoside 2-deoxyribosyltransferase
MLKIYVASSWKNPFYTQVVERLRAQGYDAYDFRADGFGWHEIDENWRMWTPAQMLDAHHHPRAVQHYKHDMAALAGADVVVAVLPFGLSAGMELGYAVGAGKHTVVYAPAIREADLMLKMADAVTTDFEVVLAFLARAQQTEDDFALADAVEETVIHVPA